jgi:hypothetical membrane protein
VTLSAILLVGVGPLSEGVHRHWREAVLLHVVAFMFLMLYGVVSNLLDRGTITVLHVTQHWAIQK